MADSADERFDIHFAGECLPGEDPAAVRERLRQRLRIDDPAALERLFSGGRQLIRRGCDRATALRYQRALRDAGARPVVTRVEAPVAAPQWTLAEAGCDVLRPEERRRPGARAVDAGDLQLTAPGTLLGTPAPPPPARPAPELGLADPGTPLAQAPRDAAPPPPRSDALQLLEGPLDLSDCAPAPSLPPRLSLEHLALAPLPEAEASADGAATPPAHRQP